MPAVPFPTPDVHYSRPKPTRARCFARCFAHRHQPRLFAAADELSTALADLENGTGRVPVVVVAVQLVQRAKLRVLQDNRFIQSCGNLLWRAHHLRG